MEGPVALLGPALALLVALAAVFLVAQRQSSRLAPAGADAGAAGGEWRLRRRILPLRAQRNLAA